MREEDVGTVIEIERESFPSPWSEGLFREELGRKFSRTLVACEDISGRVAGYIVFWIVYDESHVLNIAVSPPFRRRGIGEFMMRECEKISLGMKATYIYLEVRKGNMEAGKMYGKLGFTTIGLRKGYYTDTGEDALVMMKNIFEGG